MKAFAKGDATHMRRILKAGGLFLLLALLTACGAPAPAAPATRAGTVRPPQQQPTAVPPTQGPPCLPSGDQNDINSRLQETGIAVLCPEALFELTGPVTFTAHHQ